MTGWIADRVAQILLVEDNPGDALLVRKAVRDSHLIADVTVATNGREALAVLGDCSLDERLPRPDLILLDWKIPGVGGREVLTTIRSNPMWQRTPVVVFSSSDQIEDIQESYGLNANCFITKPIKLREFNDTIRSIVTFWTKSVVPGS